jgi:UDP-2-acetamido-3-amino-2,3-dideoxy-glucuronate N-acetyltransferase
MNDAYTHPAAVVETHQIGAGTRVWAFTHIMQGVSIGANCNIGEQCFVESGVVIGDNVTIKNGNMLWEGVTLEDGVFVGPNVSFTNDLYPRSPRLRQVHVRYSDRRWLVPTLVKQAASIGAGAVIIAGVVLGEFSMVGAGAVVTRNVPPYALVAGNPARLRGWVCQCGQPLEWQADHVMCSSCGLVLVRNGESNGVAGAEVSSTPV